METSASALERPIRGVVFSSGPVLERGVRQFIIRLEDHPDIKFLACISQSEGQTYRALIRDLWSRRGLLAFPLFMLQTINKLWRDLTHPNMDRELSKQLENLSDRIYYVTNIHSKSVLEDVQNMTPDIGLVYGSPILKPKLFEIPKYGTLGIHHGKVPEYRGKKTTFWAMYNGEKMAGVTIQKINKGLDTGQIVLTGEVPIDNKTYRTVWNDLNDLGLDLYIEAILEVKNGIADYQPQRGEEGKLYRDPKFADILVLWWRQCYRWLKKPPQ